MARPADLSCGARAMIVLDLFDPRWLEFVSHSPAATTFHHPSWAGLVARCYGYRVFVLAHTDAEGRIDAGLPVVELRPPIGPRRWVSLPFTDQCAPLDRPGARWTELMGELDDARREAGMSSLEVRSQLEGPQAHMGDVGVTHSLTLDPDPDVLTRRFKRPSVRRQIRNATRDGVEVRREDSAAALTETFYRLHLQTRRRLGVPVQPRRYFELLWSEVIEPGLGFVLVAYAQDAPIASAVFLAWNGTVSYKYGASDASAWHLRPNHLLMWTAISWGCRNGFRTFDFGRSDLTSKGLREFKDSWGSQEAPLVYTTLGDRAARAANGRMHAAVGTIVRRSPPWVCRMMGELLYKYAA
jgi:CelD/BcsL family acetyltransferase involved in cellulose biosynthesis